MFKTVVIALATAAAVTLSVAPAANAFGLASAARTMAPKAVAVQARQSDIACASASDGCHRGRTFFLTYEARVRNVLYVQSGSGEAVIDLMRRELAVRQTGGNLFALLSSAKTLAPRLG